MSPETVLYKINKVQTVHSCEILDRSLKCIEFNIGDPSSFPSGRVSESRITFTKEENYIKDGTIRMCVDQKQFTGSGNSLAKRISSQIKVSVIDSVLHIYLIGKNPLNDSAPEHANINPTLVLQIIRYITSLQSPYTNVPAKINRKFGECDGSKEITY